MELIDTHCHLTDLTERDLAATLENAKASEVSTMICVGASSGTDSNHKAFEISKKFQQVYCSVGLHPHDADNFKWSAVLEDYVNQEKVVAIGETGLDYFKNWSDFSKQKKLFENTIGIAKNAKKPLIIHCRDAHDDTLDLLQRHNADLVGGVFHCFSEGLETAKRILDLGFLISITGMITFKSATRLRETVKHLPLTSIMLETDSPYMAPEPHRGKISEPAHVRIIAETVAKIYNLPIDDVAAQTTKNAKSLFNI